MLALYCIIRAAAQLYKGQTNFYFKLQVTKEIKSFNNKIIECTFGDGSWKIMRERTDKSFPNSYKTAMGKICSS